MRLSHAGGQRVGIVANIAQDQRLTGCDEGREWCAVGFLRAAMPGEARSRRDAACWVCKVGVRVEEKADLISAFSAFGEYDSNLLWTSCRREVLIVVFVLMSRALLGDRGVCC